MLKQIFTTLLMQSCRLQGFPEDFVLPPNTSQFYRQIGNAVSVPCVAAVAEHFISSFLIPSNKEKRLSAAVFDLILQASPDRDRVLAAINRKQAT